MNLAGLRLKPIPVAVKKLDEKPVRSEEMRLVQFYESQKILDFRIHQWRRSYKIKWKDYDDSFNTWEFIPNISVLAYELAKFQALNHRYVSAIQDEWLRVEVRLKKKRLKGEPHFKRQLQLLKEFAQSYLKLQTEQLQVKLAEFLQNIEFKKEKREKRNAMRNKGAHNRTLANSKSVNRSTRKINNSSGQKVTNMTKIQVNSKAKSPFKSPKMKVEVSLNLSLINQLRREDQFQTNKSQSISFGDKTNKLKESFKVNFSDQNDEVMSLKEYRQIQELCMSKLISTGDFQAKKTKNQKETLVKIQEKSHPEDSQTVLGDISSRTPDFNLQPHSPPSSPCKEYDRSFKFRDTFLSRLKVRNIDDDVSSAKKNALSQEKGEEKKQKRLDSEKKEIKGQKKEQAYEKKDLTPQKLDLLSLFKLDQLSLFKLTTINNAGKFNLEAEDGTSENLMNMLKENITPYDIKESKPILKAIVRYYNLGDMMMFEVSIDMGGISQKRFMSYDILRDHYASELLKFLEKRQRVFL